MNRTCARGLGTIVPKRHLQGKHRLTRARAPVNAPVREPTSGASTHACKRTYDRNMRHFGTAAGTVLAFGLVAVGSAGPAPPRGTLVYSSISSTTPGRAINPETVPDLYLLRTDGRVLRRLTRSSLWEGHPAWSPDGRRIAFSKGDPYCGVVPRSACEWEGVPTRASIWVRSVNVAKAHQVTHGGRVFLDHSPAWSPDGRTVAFVRLAEDELRTGIYTVGADGQGPEQLTQNVPNGRSDSALDWSPDGSAIGFVSPEYGWIGIVDGGTGEVARLKVANLPRLRWDLAWSPTGRKLAVATQRGVYVVGSAGGYARRVVKARRADGVSWSPDGRRLAFSARMGSGFIRELRSDVFIIGVNGRGLARLTSNAGNDFGPDWRP
jgi:Tol biopolymer transport system component